MKRIEKPWGYEIWFAQTDKYVGKIMHFNKGSRDSLQYHKIKEESGYLVSGEVEFLSGPDKDHLVSERLVEGQAFHVTPGTVHRVTAITDADIAEVSTPEIEDVVHLEDDYGRV